MQSIREFHLKNNFKKSFINEDVDSACFWRAHAGSHAAPPLRPSPLLPSSSSSPPLGSTLRCLFIRSLLCSHSSKHVFSPLLPPARAPLQRWVTLSSFFFHFSFFLSFFEFTPNECQGTFLCFPLDAPQLFYSERDVFSVYPGTFEPVLTWLFRFLSLFINLTWSQRGCR